MEDILGCLDCIRDGMFDFYPPLQSLAGLRKYSPPLMDRWFNYKNFPPPIYLTEQYQEWLRRTGKTQVPEPDKGEQEWQEPLFPST